MHKANQRLAFLCFFSEISEKLFSHNRQRAHAFTGSGQEQALRAARLQPRLSPKIFSQDFL
jgi:hypothetical protein